jgi:hypothetical protein
MDVILTFENNPAYTELESPTIQMAMFHVATIALQACAPPYIAA